MSDTVKRFSKLFEGARKRIEYFIEGAIIEFTESLVSRMEELKVSKSDLAGRLKCKPSYITKVLRGGTNFTLESMVKLATVLECELRIKLVPKLAEENWKPWYSHPHFFSISSDVQNKAVVVGRPSLEWPKSRQPEIEFTTTPSQANVTKKDDNEFSFSIAA